MGRKRLIILLLFTLISSILSGQEEKPLIQLNPFSIEGIGPEESKLIVSLVQSYLSDIGQLVGYTAYDYPVNPAPKTPVPPENPVDFTINGTIRMERDGHVFMLDIANAKTGETYSVSSVYKNTGEIALKTRSVLESVFSAGTAETDKKISGSPESLTESKILGAWRGEAGIEMIRLMHDGRGLAVFSSGVQMVLSHEITGNTLKIWQISPNSERYYFPLPLDAARQLARGAEPISWELSLYEGGTVLGGVRISTAARIVNGMVTEMLPGKDIRAVYLTKSDY